MAGSIRWACREQSTLLKRGMAIPNSMGVATALNFQPTGGGKAAITGDFVVLAKEVNPVIKALRENGIAVTALHSHMLEEQPRLFFMHFWANDDALKLAKGWGGAGPDQLCQEITNYGTDAAEGQAMKRTVFTAVLAGHGRAHVVRDKKASSHGGCGPAPAETTLKQVATIDLPGPCGQTLRLSHHRLRRWLSSFRASWGWTALRHRSQNQQSGEDYP